MATSPPVSKRCRPLHGELLVDEILTRLPAAAAARSRAVCRAWNAALRSDSFIAAHAARYPPEILFFPPSPAAAATTSFYACPLPASASASAPASASAARELLTVGGLCGEYVVLSRGRPCRGLTLVLDARAGDYFVFNLSTGEHVALPPCEPAREATPLLGFPRFHPVVRPWFPFELSSTGLGFDPATAQHKAVSRIDLDGLPPPLSDELSGERNVIPLCSVGAGKTKVILLATSRHRMYAYDTERGSAEKVFDMQDYVDVPRGHGEAKLLINIGIHQERIAAVPVRGHKRLQVKLGGDRTVVASGTSSSSRDEVCRHHRALDDHARLLRQWMKGIAFPNHPL